MSQLSLFENIVVLTFKKLMRLKIISSETACPIGTKLGHNSCWVVPLKNCV